MQSTSARHQALLCSSAGCNSPPIGGAAGEEELLLLLANGLSKPYRISSNNSRHTLRARLALADHTHRPSQFLSAAALVTASKLAAEQS